MCFPPKDLDASCKKTTRGKKDTQEERKKESKKERNIER
jgi:hypothetical protein